MKTPAALVALFCRLTLGEPLDRVPLQRNFETLAATVSGRVGVCAQTRTAKPVCVNGDQRFSMQSVIKLLVGIAVLEAVDAGKWRLEDPVIVHKRDLSVYVQPIARLVTSQGYKTTVGDLVRRAIVDSDSAATDILIERLGGPVQVQAVLKRRSVNGVRIDRDERHLQTEIVGLEWKPEYVDPAVLEAAIKAVPPEHRGAAWQRYIRDERDTATPRGMVSLLHRLADGKLLSPDSTKYLLAVMQETATFPDRLKAGLSPGWRLGHKTGTGGTWNGVTAATNDVGVLTAPDGDLISIAVFIGDSRSPAPDRAALMAKLAAATIRSYQKHLRSSAFISGQY